MPCALCIRLKQSLGVFGMFGDVDAEVSLDYWSLIDSNLSATDSAAAGKADNHASIGHSADDVRAVSEDRPDADYGVRTLLC